jgi:type III secretion protein D
MELRVLSGLHRGAVMDLDGEMESLSIGASAQADVPMADAGIAALHCRLVLRGTRWFIEPLEGRVQDEGGRPLEVAAAIMPGASYRLSDVWIAFDVADEAVAQAPVPRAQAAGDGQLGAADARYPRLRTSLAGGVLALALVPLASWWVSSAWGRAEQRPQGARVAAEPASETRTALPASTLAEEFTRGLAERDLADKLDLSLSAERWDIRGSLDAEEQLRFERLLVRLMEERKPEFPINVTLMTPAELLPFKVIEVIGGKSAGIVTDAGERIAVGETVQGYRLHAVEGSKAVFTGKRRIEVVL